RNATPSASAKPTARLVKNASAKPAKPKSAKKRKPARPAKNWKTCAEKPNAKPSASAKKTPAKKASAKPAKAKSANPSASGNAAAKQATHRSEPGQASACPGCVNRTRCGRCSATAQG